MSWTPSRASASTYVRMYYNINALPVISENMVRRVVSSDNRSIVYLWWSFVKKAKMGKEHDSSFDWFKNELLTKFERLPETQKAAILIVCMFFFFCIHNLLQEAIMKSPGFEFGVMLSYFEVLG